jgi:hypothetical protein
MAVGAGDIKRDRTVPGMITYQVFSDRLAVQETSDDGPSEGVCSHLLLEHSSKDFPLGTGFLLGHRHMLFHDTTCHVLVHNSSATSATSALISFFRNLSFPSSANLPFSVS